MSNIKVDIRCENGHLQTIDFGGMPKAQVELICGFMDGTSPAYLHKPGPESPIGKCGICGKPIKCHLTVEEGFTSGITAHSPGGPAGP